jgi:ferritin
MISDKMQDVLNEQIALEGYASFFYLAVSSWCDNMGYEGSKAFFQRQSEEERMHMLKIFDYLSEVDGYAIVPAIDQPPKEFSTIQEVYKDVYAHEQKVTRSINDIMKLASEENDFTTQNFIEWYIAEQREEEALMRSILDRIKLIGDGPMSLYYIDKEIDKINQEELAAEGAA